MVQFYLVLGIGTRGPGEQKLEVDRRVVRDRISLLSKELEKAKKVRGGPAENNVKNP